MSQCNQNDSNWATQDLGAISLQLESTAVSKSFVDTPQRALLIPMMGKGERSLLVSELYIYIGIVFA